MRRSVWVIAVLLTGTVASGQVLLDYVGRDDGAFRWEKVAETQTPLGVTIYELRMTSQRWKGILWHHTLLIAKPKKVTTTTALLVIGGGRTESRGDMETRTLMGVVALNLNALVATLLAVPNQPLFNGLTEDHLLAHTFVKALERGDMEWAALLPMTKSAVKAMDALQEFAQKELGLRVEGFVVTGASKRGWTTWLTAVADPERVKGIAPMVYDNLNIPAQMRHQKEVFGTYSEQIAEYTRRGLTDLATKPEARPLVELIDPYFYRDRLTMPKLIVIGTNDRYWPLDAVNLYFDDLPREKYLLYVPNSGHGLEDRGRVLRSITAFFDSIAGRLKFPDLWWRWDVRSGDEATLTVRSDPMPQKVLIWTTMSPKRDFRESRWVSEEIKPQDKLYRFVLKGPREGFVAAFAEAFYEIGGRRFSLCTSVQILGQGRKEGGDVR